MEAPLDQIKAITFRKSSRFARPGFDWRFALPLFLLTPFAVVLLEQFTFLFFLGYLIAVFLVRTYTPDTIKLYPDRLEIEGWYPDVIGFDKIQRISGDKSGFVIYRNDNSMQVGGYQVYLLQGKRSNFFPNLYEIAKLANDAGASNIKFEMNHPNDSKKISQ